MIIIITILIPTLSFRINFLVKNNQASVLLINTLIKCISEDLVIECTMVEVGVIRCEHLIYRYHHSIQHRAISTN